MLWKNGQVCGEPMFSSSKGAVTAFVEAAALDALDPRHGSPWVQDALDDVTRAFGTTPKWQVLGDPPRKRLAPWETARSLLLFTHMFDRASPVCHGEERSQVPLYTLPIGATEREQFVFWAEAYRHVDALWIGSGSLELPAYRQLANPRSTLMANGHRLARLLERSTKRPVYSFALRSYGFASGDKDRRCPLCGGTWRVKRGRGPLGPWGFDYRCDRCRIVSWEATDLGEPRLALIGSYRGS
jgi:predicted  nucleic acid-binding Zn ribbon protein